MERDFSKAGRTAIRAKHGMVATSHPIATSAGLRVLLEGGNAVDAAITAAAVLSIAEPHMTGIGGDCFALIAQNEDPDTITALNGSGRSAKAASASQLKTAGLAAIPRHSPHAVTIPGAVDAWFSLHERFGKLEWEHILKPAIHYAEEGIAVHSRVGRDWQARCENISEDKDAASQYLQAGKPYKEGDIFNHPKLAKAFRKIAKEGRDGFYKGQIANDILEKLQSLGGVHQASDFSATKSDFVQPIFADYHDHRIWECPPNGQGVIALLLLKILERFEWRKLSTADRVHVLAEAAKQAYHLRDSYVADPEHQALLSQQDCIDWLLSSALVDDLTAIIDMQKTKAITNPIPSPPHSHTVYLTVGDKDGMMVSLINSIFDDFGSGISTPEYGILLQSRGRAFSTDSDMPNCLAGGKRPLHTIIPALISRDKKVVGTFGVMGGQYQAVGHAMLISNILALGMNPQAALDAPRSFFYDGILQLESPYGQDIIADLTARGHQIDYPSIPIGGGQAILRDTVTGYYHAGSDCRKDGMAIGY